MNRYSVQPPIVIGTFVLGALLAGCSGSSGEVTTDSEQPEQPAPAGMLRLADEAELKAAIERAFTRPRAANGSRDVVTLEPAADAGGVDRIAIPATLYSEDGAYRFEESGLHFFEIREKNDVQFAALQRVGGLVMAGPPQFASRNRSFIHGDTVYYVHDEEVWAGLFRIPGPPNGPF